ncbi:hypothetical protein KSP39_PZI023387 [Platanthera zijinensis]|uniref:Zinc finger BED domain-containing protein RICESLEEPER 2-like n=1 Tax=Platanthera zijinensis TaxID=2320716 RepID=A0AAP0FU72_9ASPA
MLDWGIQKVFTLTVDNASSNDTAIVHMRKKLAKKKAFVLDGEFFHVRCCAHILNLIVRDGMKEEGGSIEKIRLAVKYIRGSPQRVEQFRTCCELDEIPYRHNLVLDVPTRWNYTYLMLETALKFQKSFERFEEKDPHYHLELRENMPGEADWKTARIFCKFLKTFYDVTNRLSGSLYVTSNSYFHDVINIQSTIKSWSTSHDHTLKNMAIKMNEKFYKYWGDLDRMNMFLLIAVVLDPCFKLKYVTYCYGKLYSKDVVDKVENKLTGTLTRLFSYYDSERRKCNAQSSKEEEVMGSPMSELEMYLTETRIKKVVGESFDILNWWKTNSTRFPVMSLMARDVLAIPVTIVASESAFSTGGRVLDQFRSSLSPKVVEGLICAQDWLRGSPIPQEIEARITDVAELESC